MTLLQDAQTWVLFSFLIFCVIVWKFGKGKFLAILDTRIAAIKREIETAESLRVEAQELLAQYQRKQRDAAKESDEIIAAAQRHAARILDDAEKELDTLTATREQRLAERLARMEENARTAIHAYAADLAIKATAEIIARESDKKTAEALNDNAIKNIAGQLG